MSFQVSSSPTNSMTGPDLGACPVLDSQVWRGGERGGAAPCGLGPAAHTKGLAQLKNQGSVSRPTLAGGIRGRGRGGGYSPGPGL